MWCTCVSDSYVQCDFHHPSRQDTFNHRWWRAQFMLLHFQRQRWKCLDFTLWLKSFCILGVILATMCIQAISRNGEGWENLHRLFHIKCLYADRPHLFQAPPQKQLGSFTRRRHALSWWPKASGWCWSVWPAASPLRRSYGRKMDRTCVPITTHASSSATYWSTPWARLTRGRTFAERTTASARPALRRCFMTYKCLVSNLEEWS